jgi:hypothetical protein
MTFAIENIQFKAKNYKVIASGSNLDINSLNKLHDQNYNNFKHNIIFKQLLYCYDGSFINFNNSPKNKLLLSGAIARQYVEREILLKLLLSKKNNYLDWRKRDIGDKDIRSNKFIYNKVLNSYFACFTSSIYIPTLIRGKNKFSLTGRHNSHTFLLKMYEILASGSLLVMPKKEEEYIKKIGLINNENCYLIDFNKNLNQEINYIFNNIDFFNKIRKNGQEYARKNFNSDILIDSVKNIIKDIITNF